MRGLFACIAALTLCGCEPSLWSHATPTPEPVEPYTGPMRELTALEKKAIAEKVSDQLKDPASAQFKWAKARANSPTGTIPYCALVNARNSFGGYVGYKAFAVNLTSPRGAKPVVDFIGVDGTPGGQFGEIGLGVDVCQRQYGLGDPYDQSRY